MEVDFTASWERQILVIPPALCEIDFSDDWRYRGCQATVELSRPRAFRTDKLADIPSELRETPELASCSTSSCPASRSTRKRYTPDQECQRPRMPSIPRPTETLRNSGGTIQVSASMRDLFRRLNMRPSRRRWHHANTNRSTSTFTDTAKGTSPIQREESRPVQTYFGCGLNKHSWRLAVVVPVFVAPILEMKNEKNLNSNVLTQQYPPNSR